MNSLPLRVASTLVAVVILYFSYDAIPRVDGSLAEWSDGPEARAWLATRSDQPCLAPERFETGRAASEFVDRLYAAGAARVLIPRDAILEDEDGALADALVVLLPEADAQRTAVREACEQESQRGLFDPCAVQGDDAILLWWE
jgi:hypothetical protein